MEFSHEELMHELAQRETKGQSHTKLPKYAAQTARNIASGVAGIADLPMLPVHLSMMAKGINPQTISGAVGDTIDSLTGGYTKPETKGEKIAESVVQSIGSMKPTAGAAKGILNVAKNADLSKLLSTPLKYLSKFASIGNEHTASNIAATAAASGLTRKEIEEGAALPAALLIGNLGGASTGKVLKALGVGGAKTLKDIPKKVGISAAAGAGKFLGLDPRMVKVMNKAGFKESKTVGDVSKYPFIKTAQHWTAKAPFVDDSFKKTYEKRPQEYYNTLGIKKPKTNIELGKKTNETIDKIYADHDIETQRLRENFQHHLSTQSDLVDISSTIDNLKQERHGFKTNTGKEMFDNSLAGTYLKQIEKLAHENKVNKFNVVTGVTYNKGNKVPFKEATQIKSEIDKDISSAKGFDQRSTADIGALKYLRGSLSKDIENHFGTLEGEGKSAYKKYNKHYADFAQHHKPHLNELKASLRGDATGLTDLLKKSAISKGGEKVNSILSHLDSPSEKRDFVSDIFNHLSLDKQNEVSPSLFAKNFKSLEPEVQDMLLKGYGGNANKVHALIEAIDLSKDTMKHANFSNTAAHNQMSDIMKLVGRATSGALGGGAYTLGADPLTIGATYLASYGLGKGLMNNQKFIDAAAYGLTIKNKAQIPIWINKLEGVLPKDVMKGVRTTYLNEIRQGMKHGETKKSLLNALSTAKGPSHEQQKENSDQNLTRFSQEHIDEELKKREKRELKKFKRGGSIPPIVMTRKESMLEALKKGIPKC